MTEQVNAVIAELMTEGDYDGENFVSFEKNEAGEIAAVSSDATRKNRTQNARYFMDGIASLRNGPIIAHSRLRFKRPGCQISVDTARELW